MALQLITETVHEIKTLVETKEGATAPQYFIEGIFMQAEMRNQNGRIYPTNILEREIKRYQKEYIDRNRGFGELGHPDSPTVNLDRVSHMITKIEPQGNNFMGRAKIITNTPMGNIVKCLIDEGTELGVSSRGLGSLQDTGNGMEVQDDFFFATVDIVADPSAPDAFVRGIMEGKTWVWESGVLKECVLEQMAKEIDKVHIPTVKEDVRQETFIESYQKFLTALSRGVHSKIS